MTKKIKFKQKYWLLISAFCGLLVLFVLRQLKPGPKILENVDTTPLVDVVQVEQRQLDPIIVGYGRAQPKENWRAIS
jgi:hypothetical protein